MLDPNADAGKPLPAELPNETGTPSLPDPYEEPLPAGTSDEELISTALRYDLEQKVLSQAKADFPISSECSTSDEVTYECVVTFNEQPVHFTASVSDVGTTDYGGQSVVTDFSYELLEEQVVITRNAVQLAMAETVEHAADSDTPLSNPRCDAEIPDVFVAELNADSDEYHCYADPEGYAAWPNFTREYILAAHATGVSLWHD